MTKKLLAIFLCLALSLSVFAGCGSADTGVMKIEDVEIGSGLYLYYQMSAIIEASQKVEDPTANVFKQAIEEVPVKQWVSDRTNELLKQYAYVEKNFEVLGQELTSEQLEYVDSQVNSAWDSNSELLTENGVSKETYKLAVTNNMKMSILFTDIYTKGDKAVTNDDVAKYLDETYARMEYIIFTLKDVATGEVLSEDKINEVRDLAKKAVEELKGSEAEDAFANVAVKYYTLADAVSNKTDRDLSDPSSLVLSTFVEKESAYYNPDFTSQLFSDKVGTVSMFENENSSIYVYAKTVNYEDDATLEGFKSSLLSEMKAEEFEADLAEKTKDYVVVGDFAQNSKYKAEKMPISKS